MSRVEHELLTLLEHELLTLLEHELLTLLEHELLTLLEHELLTLLEHISSSSIFSGIRVVGSLVFCVMAVFLFFFFWRLYYLSLFDLWLLVTHLVFSIFSKHFSRIYSYNLQLFVEDLCLIYVICVCLRIVVSNTECVVFLFCFSVPCVPYVQCQFLCIVHFLFPLRYSLTFILQNTHHLSTFLTFIV